MFKKRLFIFSFLLVFIMPNFHLKPVSAHSIVNVTTQHNNDQRTGANLSETSLTTSNVNPTQFGKLYSIPVDGQVYAQPLYVSDVDIKNKTRNVLYIATMSNTVYCIDADDPNGEVLWSINLGKSVQLPDPNIAAPNYKDIEVEVGILSTPVISKTDGAIYFVTMTKEGNNYYHKLHALDLITGEEKFKGPKTITASVLNSQNQLVSFDSTHQAQRPAITYANGRVYIGSASFGARHPYYGWMLGYNAKTLEQEVVFNTAPDAEMAGIWSSGQGNVVDEKGDLYFLTGAGEATVMNGGKDYGDSVIKLSGSKPSNGLLGEVKDWFTPWNHRDMWVFNKDLGSSGSMLIPESDRLVLGSKVGKLYVLDKNNLGHYDATDSQIVQSVQVTDPKSEHHIHGSPIYWKGPNGQQRVYVWPEQETLKAYQFNGDKLSAAPVSQSTVVARGGMPGGFLSISADQDKAGTGIVWANMPLDKNANQQIVPGILRAFDASDLSRELWNSKINTGDDLGNFAKFVPPTIANGKVYMASFSNAVHVYGLLRQDATLHSLTLNDDIELTYDADSFTYTANVPKTVENVTVTGTVDHHAFLKINNKTVVSGQPTTPILLNLGENSIPIQVITADGTQTNYTLIINREGDAPGPAIKFEAEEADLIIAAKATDHLNYSGTGFVDNYTNGHLGASTTFKVNAESAGARNVTLRYSNGTDSPKTLSVYVNGTKIKQTTLPITTNWDTWQNVIEKLTLTAGNNIISYKYDAEDTANVNLDYISVPGAAKPPVPDNALLSSLSINGEPFSLSDTVFNYSTIVENSVNAATVVAQPADNKAKVVIKSGTAIAPEPISLRQGDNVITLEVTSGTTKKTYTVIVTRLGVPEPIHDNALLSGLSLSGITLNETVSSTVYRYTATVPYEITTTTVTPHVADQGKATAVIKLDGEIAPNQIPLKVGNNEIIVEVTAGDRITKKNYTVIVTRRAIGGPEGQTPITRLSLSGIQLDKPFSPSDLEYTATVSNAVYHTSVIVETAVNATTTIKLNGATVSNPLSLVEGPNEIVVEGTTGTGVKRSYTIVVTRDALSTNALLSQLKLSGITLEPTFINTVFDYKATVNNVTDSTNISFSTANSKATTILRMNGNLVTNPLSLREGINTITIEVTAQDGVTKKTSTINVTRPASGGGGGGGGAGGGGGGGAGGGGGNTGSTTSVNLSPIVTPKPTEIITDALGKKILLVKPDKDKLIAQIAVAASEIVIDGTSTEAVHQLTIELSGAVIEKAKESKKAIVFKGNNVQFTLTPDAISVNVERSNLKFQIAQSNDLINMPLGQSISPTFEFTLSADDLDVPMLSKKMEVIFKVDPSKIQNPSRVELYRFNEENQKWEYTLGTLHEGEVKAMLSDFSKYAVFEVFKTFSDIQGHWAQKQIENMAIRQVIEGMTDTTFEPEAKVTRAQFVSILARALNLPTIKSSNPFTDIPADAWYMESVNAAYHAKIVSGMDATTFGPNELITREQMATLLINAHLYATGKKLLDLIATGNVNYLDAADISSWAKENVKLASQLGFMNGNDNGTFSPSATATRAQAAIAIYRLLNKQ